MRYSASIPNDNGNCKPWVAYLPRLPTHRPPNPWVKWTPIETKHQRPRPDRVFPAEGATRFMQGSGTSRKHEVDRQAYVCSVFFWLLANFWQTLRGPFSAVSTPKFASKYSFESSWRDLQDLLTFAPFESNRRTMKSASGKCPLRLQKFGQMSSNIFAFLQFIF